MDQRKGAAYQSSGREQYVGAVGGRSGKWQWEEVVAWGSKWNGKVVGSSAWELWKGAVVGRSGGREQQWEGAVRRSYRREQCVLSV